MKMRLLAIGLCAAALSFSITGCGVFDFGDDDNESNFKAKTANKDGQSIDPAYMNDGKSGNPDISSSHSSGAGDGPGAWSNQALGGEGAYSDFGTPILGVTFDTVYFKFDQSMIGTSEHSKLDKVAEYLLKNPGTGVVIEGHCDDRGSDEYNRGLGERRALASKEYLATKGISEERMRTVSYGEEKPAVPNSDESARAKNRRDEFVAVKLK